VGLVAGVSAAIAFATGSSAAQAATFHPSAPTQTFVVSSLGDAGPGSLRAAILAANATAAGSSSLISFSVNGTITLAGPLPTIARTVSIDATSAPTYVSGGAPVVAIDFLRRGRERDIRQRGERHRPQRIVGEHGGG
jgi:hypothetical protein